MFLYRFNRLFARKYFRLFQDSSRRSLSTVIILTHQTLGLFRMHGKYFFLGQIIVFMRRLAAQSKTKCAGIRCLLLNSDWILRHAEVLHPAALHIFTRLFSRKFIFQASSCIMRILRVSIYIYGSLLIRIMRCNLM